MSYVDDSSVLEEDTVVQVENGVHVYIDHTAVFNMIGRMTAYHKSLYFKIQSQKDRADAEKVLIYRFLVFL